MSTAASLRLAVRDGDHQLVAVELETEALATGGDAAIHGLTGAADRVAKVYHDPAAEPRRRAKLDAMLAAPPEGRTVEHGDGRIVQLAWPEALLEREAGESAAGVASDELGTDAPPSDELATTPPAGFVMPRVDLADAALLELLLSPRARRSAEMPEGYRFRVAAARNLAAAVGALHAAGHHVVDLKPDNVHVYRDTGFVAILDCDGFSIAGPCGERFPAHQYTDGYIAPEALTSRALPEALGEDQDRFALAVVVFRLLNGGLHPFQGVPRPGADIPTTNGGRVAAGLYPYGDTHELAPPPSSRYHAFDAETQALFDRAFDGSSARRPTAAAWSDHLSALLDGVLRPCDRSPDHARYGDGPCVVCRPKPPPDPAKIQAAMDRVQTPSPRQWRAPAAARARTSPPTQSAPHRPPVSTQTAPSPASAVRAFTLLIAAAVLVVGFLAWWIGSAPRKADEPPSELDLRWEVALGNYERIEEADPLRVDWTAGLDREPFLFRRSVYAPLNEVIGLPRWRWTNYDALDHLQPGLPSTKHTAYLHLAARQRDPVTTEALLRRGVPVDAVADGRTALMLAAANAGTPVRLPPGVGARVLSSAESRARSIRAYLDADPKQRGPRPDTVTTDLIRALGRRLAREPVYAQSGYYSDPGDTQGEGVAAELVRNATVVRLLLRAGASVRSVDWWGRTPLAYAASVGNVVTVRQLVKAGADPNAADSAGVTPLMVAADQAATPTSDRAAAAVVAALLDAGADPAATDLAGRTAADYVGERASTRTVRQILFGDAQTGGEDKPPLDAPLTLGVLRAASQAADNRQTAELATVERVPITDIGDGGTRFGFDPDTLAFPYALEAWPDALPSEITVACDVRTPRSITVDVWLKRGGRGYGDNGDFYVGRLWEVHDQSWSTAGRSRSVTRTYSRNQTSCLRKVKRQLAETQLPDGSRQDRLYDLRGVPDRWPRATVTVYVNMLQPAPLRR